MTDDTTATPAASMSDDARERLVAELVNRAHAEGGDLVGPDGLLAEVTKRVLETGLEVEISEHLGYDKYAVEGRDGGNSTQRHPDQDGADRRRARHDRRAPGP
jgi:putative transposase